MMPIKASDLLTGLYGARRRRASQIAVMSTAVLLGALASGLSACVLAPWGQVDGNGKLTASARLAHPMKDVAQANLRALTKLDELSQPGQLNPDATTARLSHTFQQVTRLRAAGAAELGPQAASPQVPVLPSGDAATLTSPTFTSPASATQLIVDPSPFDRIAMTRDIYESLLPAELRFKFDSLREQDYQFFHIPITVGIHPGPHTDDGYIADIRFEIPLPRSESCDGNPLIGSLSLLDSLRRVSNLKTDDTQLHSFASTHQLRQDAYCDTVKDVRVFTVSPMRQFDRRAESLARRIQLEQALQLQLAGPIGEAGAAAINASADRVQRLEKDFAAVTLQPRLTGYVDGETAFGWRSYPAEEIDEDGRDTQPRMPPGPRDVLAIIALKYKGDAVAEATTVTIPIFFTSRWIRMHYSPFRSAELPPENDMYGPYFSAGGLSDRLSKDPAKDNRGTGWLYPVIPPAPRTPPTLVGVIHPIAAGVDMKVEKKAALFRIDGAGFTENTRVVVNGKSLAPTALAKTQLLFAIDPKEFPGEDKPYGVALVDGHKNIAIVKMEKSGRLVDAQINVRGEPAEPTVSLVSRNNQVAPGAFVDLKFSKPISDIPVVRVGSERVDKDDVVVMDKDKGAFGFIAPNQPRGPGGQWQILVTIDSKNYKVADLLTYLPPLPQPTAPVKVELTQ